MYTKDKSTRITLRLNEGQFNFVKAHSDMLGVSPSEFLRMVINATMSATVSNAVIDYAQDCADSLNSKKEVLGRENDKTDSDNFV